MCTKNVFCKTFSQKGRWLHFHCECIFIETTKPNVYESFALCQRQPLKKVVIDAQSRTINLFRCGYLDCVIVYLLEVFKNKTKRKHTSFQQGAIPNSLL